MVKVLLEVEKDLHQALDVAIRQGYPSVVEELIKGGADINYVNEYKDTPLIIAVEHAYPHKNCKDPSRHKQKIIQTLLEAGADVSHVNKHGRTALMQAVVEHDLDTVQSLLKDPKINCSSFFGFATKPVNYADEDGNTALMLAIKYVRYLYIGNQEYNMCISSQNIFNTLLETPGIDAHYVNKNGETAVTLLEELNREIKGYPY